jgi:hypothetical protein
VDFEFLDNGIKTHVGTSVRIRRVNEIAKMLDQIVAPPNAEEPRVETVKVEPSVDLEARESDTVVVDPQSE